MDIGCFFNNNIWILSTIYYYGLKQRHEGEKGQGEFVRSDKSVRWDY